MKIYKKCFGICEKIVSWDQLEIHSTRLKNVNFQRKKAKEIIVVFFMTYKLNLTLLRHFSTKNQTNCDTFVTEY